MRSVGAGNASTHKSWKLPIAKKPVYNEPIKASTILWEAPLLQLSVALALDRPPFS